MTHSRLLDLPPELRNRIYELVADEDEAFKLKMKKYSASTYCIQSKSSIILVCQQLHDEYLDVLQKVVFITAKAEPVAAVVTDFDFSDVLTALRDMPKRYHATFRDHKRLHIRFVPFDISRLTRVNALSWFRYCFEHDMEPVLEVLSEGLGEMEWQVYWRLDEYRKDAHMKQLFRQLKDALARHDAEQKERDCGVLPADAIRQDTIGLDPAHDSDCE